MYNLEICKRIAEIEGLIIAPYSPVSDWLMVHTMQTVDSSVTPFDPLTDDALCFKFAVDDKMMLSWVECPAGSGKAYFVNVGDKSTDYCDTPNRAVCMAKLKVFSND